VHPAHTMTTFEEQASGLRNSIPDLSRLVFFAGAGISVPSGYPLWKAGTTEALRLADSKGLIAPGALAYAREELAKDAYYRVFDILKEQLPEAAFTGIATNVFGKVLRPCEPHELLVGVPCRGVITTNFDECLAAAYAAKTGAIPIDDMQQAMASNRFFVVKPHGSINNPKSMVLTTNDWRRVESDGDF
jgi:NAD-dependent SIR2 family protein deacetylase